MKVADLTLDELREFIRETVDERLAEIADDEDELELRPEFVALLKERLESAHDHVDFSEALKSRGLKE